MDEADNPPSGATGLFTPPISIVLSSSRGACSRSHCRCDGFLPNYWDGHYCRNCLHLATFHDPNSASEPSGGAPQPSTWHSFPKSWDKSRFLASLGVAPLSDAKGTAIPRGRSDSQPPRRAGGRGAHPGAATAATTNGDDVSDSDSDGQPTGRAYGRGPLWKSDGSHPIGVERRHPAGDASDEASLNQTVFITPTATQSSAAAIEAAKAAEAQAEAEAKEMTALMEIVTALCVQQKENEASLEEVTVVMGELERKWRAEQRENEKERRQARRHYEDNMKKRDAEIMRMREELKRERCLREMAEDRVKRADDAAKAACEDLAFIVACVQASGGNFLPPPAASLSSSSGLDRRGKKEGGEGGDDGEDGDGGDDDGADDDWTTAKTFEKRPANFFLPAPVAVLSGGGGGGGGGRDSPTRHPDSPGRVDELDSDTSAKNENGGVVPAAKNESEARRNDEGSSVEEKTAAASKRDEVLEQMAAIYWKERREHRVTKEALERDIREQRARIEKLEQENEKLIDKIQEIELRELAVLEKEKRMSLTPEEGERRKLEYLFEKLLNVGNMVSEITHEIQLIKK